MPKGESKTLLNACTYFGIEVRESHRALSDAISAHRLYQEMSRGKQEEYLLAELLQCKVKKDVPATQRQKEYLQKLSPEERDVVVTNYILNHGSLWQWWDDLYLDIKAESVNNEVSYE